MSVFFKSQNRVKKNPRDGYHVLGISVPLRSHEKCYYEISVPHATKYYFVKNDCVAKNIVLKW